VRVFYHNDPDGRCSAAVVVKKLGDKVKLTEMDYAKEVPVDSITLGEKIYIVDFSFQPDVMKKVLKRTTNVVWIDHHNTARAYEKAYGTKLDGLRNFEDQAEAGCELTWRFFYPDSPAPAAVRLVGDYDKWAHRLADSTPFFEGLKLQPGASDPRSQLWKTLLMQEKSPSLADKVDRIRDDGRIGIKYRDAYCRDMRKSYGYETELGGLKCYAMCVYGFGSKAFGELMKRYQACIAYTFDGKQFTVSMYSDSKDIDVSKVCKDNGGGGHKNAAGFTCKTLPFKPTEKDEKAT